MPKNEVTFLLECACAMVTLSDKEAAWRSS